MTLPTILSHRDRAKRAIDRAASFARVSAAVMIGFGGVFSVVGLRHPLSPSFLVSLAVLINGIIEWRNAAALRRLDPRAPRRLAANQTALAAEIVIYALVQARLLTPELIDEIFLNPVFARVLELYPRDVVVMVREMLPELVKGFYYLVAVVAVLGCGGTAFYYRSRSKPLAKLRTCPPPLESAGRGTSAG